MGKARRLGKQLLHRAERGQALLGDPCHLLQHQCQGNASSYRQIYHNAGWRWGPRFFLPLSLASALSRACFLPHSQRSQKKNKIWDLKENPAAGWTHVGLTILLRPLKPVPPCPKVKMQSHDGLKIVSASGCSGGGPCKIRTVWLSLTDR